MASGGGNPLGGGGTPFAPVVGVRYGQPITFKVKPFKEPADLVTAEAKLEKNTDKQYIRTIHGIGYMISSQ